MKIIKGLTIGPNLNLKDKISLTHGQIVSLPHIKDTKENAIMLFEKGTIGTITGLTLNHSNILTKLTLSFEIYKGIKIQIDVMPEDVKKL
jgi:hypothetical protein